MVYYLEQILAAHTLLADGHYPEWLLHPLETRRLRRFRLLKRRRDWLLGRWTAKHLIQSYLNSVSGDKIALDEIYIGNDADGAPYAALLPPQGENRSTDQADQRYHRLPLSLSISHSGDRALCAICPAAFGSVGADIERVENRDLSFVETFFTEEEMEVVTSLDALKRDIITTAIWSAKEAVLKSLRTGLRTDTRQVQCLLNNSGEWGLSWSFVELTLGHSLASSLPSEQNILAWWRFHGSYVKTLAIITPWHARHRQIIQLHPLPQAHAPNPELSNLPANESLH